MKTIRTFSIFLFLLSCLITTSCKDDDNKFTLADSRWTGSVKIENFDNYYYSYVFVFKANNTGGRTITDTFTNKVVSENFNYSLDLERNRLMLFYPDRDKKQNENYDVLILSNDLISITLNTTMILTRTNPK